jgi:hypothetical protein
LTTLEAATNKFSLENKIASGGFGQVYKVVLINYLPVQYDINKIGFFLNTYTMIIINWLFLFLGEFARWTTNSRKKTFKKFRTRHDRIQK